jgi:hypothetical protein
MKVIVFTKRTEKRTAFWRYWKTNQRVTSWLVDDVLDERTQGHREILNIQNPQSSRENDQQRKIDARKSRLGFTIGHGACSGRFCRADCRHALVFWSQG